MNLSESREEYCKYMYDRIITKLKEADEYELLSFTVLGLDHMLRPKDILNIKWNQVDFNSKCINEIKLHKNDFITDIDLIENSFSILKEWYEKTNDKMNIFPKLKQHHLGRKIGELIGDETFNTHEIRGIGIVIKSMGFNNLCRERTEYELLKNTK